jgi:hypothetical protein
VKTETDVFYLSRHPMPLTPEDVTLLLGKVKADHNDIVSKKIIISLIEHRLSHRYIRPLSHVPVEPVDYKSGFLMMAAACLLIETLYCFRKGKNDTLTIRGEKAFDEFFTDHQDLFKNFDKCFPRGYTNNKGEWKKDGCSFYKHIRCGILHQAETTGGYRIFRNGELFDCKQKAINANKFLEQLGKCIEKYIGDLHKRNCREAPWPRAIEKLKFICNNCREDKSP